VTAFQHAYARERATFRACSNLSELEYRANRRFRLWEKPDNHPTVVALMRRLGEKQQLRCDHEDASFLLSRSLHLPNLARRLR
jgi:hypothetical protein